MQKIYTREIKFLAYHIQSKEIFEVSKISFIDKLVYHKKGSEQTYNFEDVEVLEYSGNQDMNGKDIYEGHVPFDPENNQYYEVLFRADRFMIERRLTSKYPLPDNPKDNEGYQLADLYPISEELKIVGFIFEKDLLEKVGYNSKIHDQA